jgi:hypothetical protein
MNKWAYAVKLLDGAEAIDDENGSHSWCIGRDR